MPERKKTYRVDSTEVQGEDSWVELSYVTFAGRRGFLASRSDKGTEELLQEHLVAWNWVDSEGEPFGDPKDHILDLYHVEVTFILDALFSPRSVAEVKN